jgi:hypothetical protein
VCPSGSGTVVRPQRRDGHPAATGRWPAAGVEHHAHLPVGDGMADHLGPCGLGAAMVAAARPPGARSRIGHAGLGGHDPGDVSPSSGSSRSRPADSARRPTTKSSRRTRRWRASDVMRSIQTGARRQDVGEWSQCAPLNAGPEGRRRTQPRWAFAARRSGVHVPRRHPALPSAHVEPGAAQGSLEKATFQLFSDADLGIHRNWRSPGATIADPSSLACASALQEIPVYVADGLFDLGVCGRDGHCRSSRSGEMGYSR